jgi:hypothetical protein
MSVVTKEWWEAVCQQLNRDPNAATKIITEFRDSDQALQASTYFLQQATGCSPAAQFQAALILQYVCLKQWSSLSVTTTQELRGTLWTLIHTSLSARSMPPFALNKIMQVYALLWKRGWHEIDESQRNELFQQIGAFLHVPELMKSGSAMLRTIVEEFCSRSSAEIGLPLEFHRIAHMSFEAHGLDNAVSIATECLSFSFSGLANTTSVDDPASREAILRASANISEASKLVIEVISWDFGNVDRFTWIGGGGKATADKDKLRSNELLNLPRSWAQYFLQGKFIDDIFTAYEKLRYLLLKAIVSPSGGGAEQASFGGGLAGGAQAFVSSPQDAAMITNSIVSALGELRLLMTALASVSGKFEIVYVLYFTY